MNSNKTDINKVSKRKYNNFKKKLLKVTNLLKYYNLIMLGKSNFKDSKSKFRYLYYEKLFNFFSTIDNNINNFRELLFFISNLEIKGIGTKFVDTYIAFFKKDITHEVVKDITKNLTPVKLLIILDSYKSIGINNLFDISETIIKYCKSHKINIPQSNYELYKIVKYENVNVGNVQKKNILSKNFKKTIIDKNKLPSILNIIRKTLIKLKPFYTKVNIAGSVRRKSDSIKDIDLVILTNNVELFLENFNRDLILVQSFRNAHDENIIKYTGIYLVENEKIQIDLNFVSKEENYPSALLHFTGSKYFNIALRKIAIHKGYTLSEYGLFDRSSLKFINVDSEKEIFNKLGLKYIHPTNRGYLVIN